MRLGTHVETMSAARAAWLSQRALDVDLATPAELRVNLIDDAATLCGAFQRRSADDVSRVFRRVSGGARALVGPGTLHVLLSLERCDVLTPCPPERLVNRYVRPLLRALTAAGASASFFDRDWFSVGKRPAGAIGFAHDAASRRAVVEAFVAVRAPFSREARASFRDKVPGTLEEIAGRAFDLHALAQRIVDSYVEAYQSDRVPVGDSPAGEASDLVIDSPWTATTEEAIGLIGAGRDPSGALIVGGDLLASRDAVREVASRVDTLVAGAAIFDATKVGAIVDDVFRRPGIAIDGVKSLSSIADVLARAAQNRA